MVKKAPHKEKNVARNLRPPNGEKIAKRPRKMQIADFFLLIFNELMGEGLLFPPAAPMEWDAQNVVLP